MESGLTGQTVVVAGANANIGRAVSLAFAAEGANVVVVGGDLAQGQLVGEQVLEHGANGALWQVCDVTDRRQVGDMVAAVRGKLGAVDIPVNCVGGNVGLDAFVDSDPETG